MKITAHCPKCGKSGTAPHEAIGRTATCKACGVKFVVVDSAARKDIAKPAAGQPLEKSIEVVATRSPVAVIGDPNHGIEMVVQLFNKRGIKTGELGEGPTIQPVVVVVAGHDGPTEKFRDALVECATHVVQVIGIVYSSVHTDMQDLIEGEIIESIVHFVPGTERTLPSWRLEEPKLPVAIGELLKLSANLETLRSAVTLRTGPKPKVEPKSTGAPSVVRTQGQPIVGPDAWRILPNWMTSTATYKSHACGRVRLTDPSLETMMYYFNSPNNRDAGNTAAVSRIVQALGKLNRDKWVEATEDLTGVLQMTGLASQLICKAHQCRAIIRTMGSESSLAADNFTTAMETFNDKKDLAWSLLWRGRAFARSGFREAAVADFQAVAGMEQLKQLPYLDAIRTNAQADLREVS